MMLKVLIAEEAEAEIKSAKRWYEKQKIGLGEEFASIVKETISSLKSDKMEHRKVFGAVRRVVVRRFPYFIYYKRDKQCVRILAVLHHRQDQQRTRDRAE